MSILARCTSNSGTPAPTRPAAQTPPSPRLLYARGTPEHQLVLVRELRELPGMTERRLARDAATPERPGDGECVVDLSVRPVGCEILELDQLNRDAGVFVFLPQLPIFLHGGGRSLLPPVPQPLDGQPAARLGQKVPAVEAAAVRLRTPDRRRLQFGGVQSSWLMFLRRASASRVPIIGSCTAR